MEENIKMVEIENTYDKTLHGFDMRKHEQYVIEPGEKKTVPEHIAKKYGWLNLPVTNSKDKVKMILVDNISGVDLHGYEDSTKKTFFIAKGAEGVLVPEFIARRYGWLNDEKPAVRLSEQSGMLLEKKGKKEKRDKKVDEEKLFDNEDIESTELD